MTVGDADGVNRQQVQSLFSLDFIGEKRNVVFIGGVGVGKTHLKRKVLRNGNFAVFEPGTGITDGETRSAAGVPKLLGVPVELVMKTVPGAS